MCEEEEIDYKDKYLRLLAESENLRKRLVRDREETVKHAIADAMIDLFKPLDQLETALEHSDNAPPEVQNWAIGFKMILSQFKDVLEEQEIVAFDAMGQPFDPHHHEAIEMIESDDHPPGTVVEVEVKGYRMGDRTIRPARVKVTKEIEKNQEEEDV